MSHDILLFDPAHAPRAREAFLQWWDAYEWSSEPHPHNDLAFTTPILRGWFLEMIERFPPLNGPYASSRDQRSADYSIGYHLIYMAMWFDKEAAHERAHELAGKHRVGLFEASSPHGEIWLPGAGTELVLASKRDEQRWPRNQKRIVDPRVAALLEAHPTGGTIVWDWAFAENPRRRVNVVYSRKSSIEAMTSPLVVGPQRALVDLQSALAAAKIRYAVVEQDEQQAFGRQLADACLKAPDEPSKDLQLTVGSGARGNGNNWH